MIRCKEPFIAIHRLLGFLAPRASLLTTIRSLTLVGEEHTVMEELQVLHNLHQYWNVRLGGVMHAPGHLRKHSHDASWKASHRSQAIVFDHQQVRPSDPWFDNPANNRFMFTVSSRIMIDYETPASFGIFGDLVLVLA